MAFARVVDLVGGGAEAGEEESEAREDGLERRVEGVVLVGEIAGGGTDCAVC